MFPSLGILLHRKDVGKNDRHMVRRPAGIVAASDEGTSERSHGRLARSIPVLSLLREISIRTGIKAGSTHDGKDAVAESNRQCRR